MNILKIQDLVVTYGTIRVLDEVSFVVNAGDYVGIVGPNGAGKSTLVKALLGMVPIDQGHIELFGEPHHGFRTWNRVGYLPQVNFIPLPRFPATVAEIVSTGILSSKSFPRRLGKADREKIDETLLSLGLHNIAGQMIGRLSGGQQQRVFLARALVSSPDILILDEPTMALDPVIRDSFYKSLQKLNRDKKTAILMITHDTATIGQYASSLLYLDNRVVFDGTFEAFCTSEEMATYFGEFGQHLICHQHDGQEHVHRTP